ncbi:MAG: hypothetical protein HAW61_04015 [Candidatus Portiera sp.]|nr:hypothetical protein [Portiera sp.]
MNHIGKNTRGSSQSGGYESHNANNNTQHMQHILDEQQIEANSLTLPLYGFKVIEATTKVRNEGQDKPSRNKIDPSNSNDILEDEQYLLESKSGILEVILETPKRVIRSLLSGER